MRKITAIAAALGFFLAANAPSFAATPDTTAIELAAKKKVDRLQNLVDGNGPVTISIARCARRDICGAQGDGDHCDELIDGDHPVIVAVPDARLGDGRA